MSKTLAIASVTLLLAIGCSGDDDDSSNGNQSSQKTCADLQACCNKVSDADKKKNCQTVHDALIGQQNADLGCSTALGSGWSKECP